PPPPPTPSPVDAPALACPATPTIPRRASTTDSATGPAREEAEDSIEPPDDSLIALDLAKTATVLEALRPPVPPRPGRDAPDDDRKALRERSRQLMGVEAAGILFCF
ncbi:hypothetical protein Tdes44962_MAKER10141, partial [Teratosphaeria destructans]